MHFSNPFSVVDFHVAIVKCKNLYRRLGERLRGNILLVVFTISYNRLKHRLMLMESGVEEFPLLPHCWFSIAFVIKLLRFPVMSYAKRNFIEHENLQRVLEKIYLNNSFII